MQERKASADRLLTEQELRREQGTIGDLQEQLVEAKQQMTRTVCRKDQELQDLNKQAIDLGAAAAQSRVTISQLEEKVQYPNCSISFWISILQADMLSNVMSLAERWVASLALADMQMLQYPKI